MVIYLYLWNEEYSAKNKLDILFFTRLFVPQASQSSPYRRIKFEIWFAIPPTKEMSAEWRLLCTQGLPYQNDWKIWESQKKMSLQELSDATGIPSSTLGNYENIQISQYPICISMMMQFKYWLTKNIIHSYYQNYCLMKTSTNSWLTWESILMDLMIKAFR